MTTRFAALAVGAVALAGCTIADAHADWETTSDVTPYRCDGLVPAAQTASADPSIAAPWRALADDTVTDPTGWIATVAAMPAAAPSGTTEERVRLQHQLLRVAARLERYASYVPATPHAAETRAAIMKLVTAVAPSARELDALGDAAHPQVAAVLGADPVERSTRNCGSGSLIHVSHFGGLLAFRPLRSGTTHALVAQIVAFDPAGAPHITPLVDDIELRRGDGTSAAACVVAAGDDGILRTVGQADLEDTQFVHRRGSGVTCVGCHHTDNAFAARDVTDAAELSEIDRARFGQVNRLAARTFELYVAPE